MTDRDPVADILERVEHPVAPSEPFASNLLADVLAALETDGRSRRGRSRRPRLPAVWRRVLTVAAALAIAVGGLALLSPVLRLNHAPALPASVADLGPFPPISFRGTIVAGRTDQTAEIPIGEVTYVSAFSWSVTARGDSLQGDPLEYPFGDGGAVARDGDVVTLYSSLTNSIRTVAVRSASIAPIYSPARLLTWSGTQAFSWAKSCASGRIMGAERVRGLQAVRVHCPDVKLLIGGAGSTFGGKADVWVDPSTGIVLRIETAGAPRTFSDRLLGLVAGQRWELTDLQIGDVASTTFTPPPDAIDATDRTVLTSVRLGQPMPSIQLPLISGGTTTLSGTPGTPTAIYFWDRSCYGAHCSMLTLIEQLVSRTDIDVVVVLTPRWTDAQEIRRALAPAHVTVPVALDPNGLASRLIAGEESDTLLLLDRSGNLAGAYSGNYGGILGDILDTFAAGKPLPRPPAGAEAELP